MKMLSERSEKIKAEEWEELKKIEKEIDEEVEKDQNSTTDDRDSFIRPTAAFITFETEEGF